MKLSPCPFCGADDIAMHPNDIAASGSQMATQDGAQVQYAHCDGCGAEGPQAFTYEEAVAGWNQRSPATDALKNAVRPLLDAWKGYREKSQGPRSEGYSDAYYLLAKHRHADWEALSQL